MIRLHDLIGQQAISLATAERTGTVKGIVLDGNRIIGVDVGDSIINTSAVRTFEGDVLTYDTDTPFAVDKPATNPAGNRVLDTHGDQLGSIADLEITASGEVETVVLDNGERISGERLRAIGGYAAIVSADVPPSMR